ncbi:Uncharacterised protein [Acinetobacter baumannii]|uniref:hypothetical protein n=1 Tax=Acinetobacter baumannii TaxID=470 RepID=UPI000DE5E09D|nr:hypothetical protein [Acinetobacter baumannii]MDC4448725.1 hypothetical protein [Acinetobacter baumannii]MDC4660307.1 hypothetical protein [Acinetobacter baumannii]MDC5191849.1 hypothetical protein [Acinetobacter baumannii]MDC5568093.1 hypothetical protein [Acinetobacter baumannii]SSP29875.1 Uncharacterised protein [Acinetobacter baumannii]
MNIYFKGYRVFNLIFKPTLGLINFLEDLHVNPHQGKSAYSIRSKILPYPEDDDVNNITEFTFFVRVEFSLKPDTLKDNESEFSFTHIVELITDIDPEKYISDESFIKQANQLAYVSLSNFIVNLSTNCGFSPIYIPLAKMSD